MEIGIGSTLTGQLRLQRQTMLKNHFRNRSYHSEFKRICSSWLIGIGFAALPGKSYEGRREAILDSSSCGFLPLILEAVQTSAG